jgi:acetyl-CoA carboxylase carboxyl transferase subunit alpha
MRAQIIKKNAKQVSKVKKKPTAWECVQLARLPQRPLALDYILNVFNGFQEIHGDRFFGDDSAVIAGTAFLDDLPVMLIGQQRGRDTKENLERNFGMMHPEGYRKALRVMKLAEKFLKPIITLIDTSGAFPGVGAEERGQAEAIAKNLFEMAKIKVPIISVVIGEGGSGGALGIGVANKVLMMENSIYSVISPEGCATILWKNRELVQQASEVLRLTALDLFKAHIVDGIIPEPVGGAQLNYAETYKNFKKNIVLNLKPLLKLSPQTIVEQRYKRFRSIGEFEEMKS